MQEVGTVARPVSIVSHILGRIQRLSCSGERQQVCRAQRRSVHDVQAYDTRGVFFIEAGLLSDYLPANKQHRRLRWQSQ